MGHILILLACPLVDHCSFDMRCLVCDLVYMYILDYSGVEMPCPELYFFFPHVPINGAS